MGRGRNSGRSAYFRIDFGRHKGEKIPFRKSVPHYVFATGRKNIKPPPKIFVCYLQNAWFEVFRVFGKDLDASKSFGIPLEERAEAPCIWLDGDVLSVDKK